MDSIRYILAGSFIDGISEKIGRNVLLTLKDSIIAAIGSTTDLPADRGAIIDDFSHCTILPAFIDCSAYLLRSPSILPDTVQTGTQVNFAESMMMLEKHAGFCHAYGVLGVVDNDDITEQLNHWQAGIKTPDLVDVLVPEIPDQVGSDAHAHGQTAEGGILKINYSNSIDDGTFSSPVLNREILRKMVQGGGRKKTVVRANGRQQVEDALATGCDAIEQGYAMGEENLRTMAAENILWIPNLLRAKNGLDSSASGGNVCCRFSQRYVAPGEPVPGAEEFWQKTLSEQLRLLRLAKDLGVKTAIGTGAGATGILHGEAVAEEIKLFIKAGFTLQEAIRCASENGAVFFGMNNLGALKVGQKATFLITRGTAGQLPRKLSYLEGIYINGVPSHTYCKNPDISG